MLVTLYEEYISMRSLIIAEAGVNHNGDIDLAKKLVDAAALAKVDYVKFQTFKAEKLVSKKAEMAEYQKNNTKKNTSQLSMLKKLELDESMHRELIAYCKEKEVKFLSTAFDLDSVDLLLSLGIDIFKVPSGEINNYPYLRKIGGSGKPVILSTGMASLGEIEAAIDVLKGEGLVLKNLTLLHCNTEYPTQMGDVNLNAMKVMGSAFGVKYGYSDHTLGIEVPIAAIALGAVCIEKHFTLDKNMEGPDHAASLEPDELKEMVTAIRNIELALGDGVKRVTPSEAKNKHLARKSITALCKIKKGELFTDSNLTVKRPGTGINPMLWKDVIGRVAIKDFEEEELIVLH